MSEKERESARARVREREIIIINNMHPIPLTPWREKEREKVGDEAGAVAGWG